LKGKRSSNIDTKGEKEREKDRKRARNDTTKRETLEMVARPRIEC